MKMEYEEYEFENPEYYREEYGIYNEDYNTEIYKDLIRKIENNRKSEYPMIIPNEYAHDFISDYIYGDYGDGEIIVTGCSNFTLLSTSEKQKQKAKKISEAIWGMNEDDIKFLYEVIKQEVE